MRPRLTIHFLTVSIRQAVREHLSRIQEALLCSICMDNDIEVAFCPCGHSLACLPCAQRCDQCPVCRANISHTQTIFLPLIGIEKPSDGKDQGKKALHLADFFLTCARFKVRTFTYKAISFLLNQLSLN